MGKCKICGVEVPRGQRYKGARYANLTFCSPECYNIYCKDKDEGNVKHPYRLLTDYIQSIYPTEYQNWELFTRQIQSFNKEYGLSYNDVRAILRYAVEYEDYHVEPEYGLGQFIPKYIDATRKFIQSIKANNEFEVPEVEVNKVRKQKRTAKIKLEDW